MAPRRNRYIFSYKKKKEAATRRRVLTVILLLIVLLIAATVAFLIYNSTIHIDLVSNRTVEVKTPVKASQFINSIGNGTLVEDCDVDTSTPGKKSCDVKIKVGTDIRDYSFNVNVVDTQPPVISGGETSVNLLKGTSLDILTKAEAQDNSGEEITVTVEGEYNPDVVGTQVLKFVAVDSSGNKAEQEMTVNVIELGDLSQDIEFTTNKGHHGAIRGGILYMEDQLIVNRTYGLPEDFDPGFNEETRNAFNAMASDAMSQAGLELYISGSYRSYYEQAQLFDFYAYELEEGYDTMSTMRPGHSEHQSGYAIDLNELSYEFAYTEEYKWLLDHCADYGFIIRYPENKVDITGCLWEPWHIRYVGTDLAAKLRNDGDWITLEEYFGLTSRYED